MLNRRSAASGKENGSIDFIDARFVFLASTGKATNFTERRELQHTAVTNHIAIDRRYVANIRSSKSVVNSGKVGKFQSSYYLGRHFCHQALVVLY